MQKRVSLGILTVFLLGGCGLLSSPPIADPFGLEGKTSTFTLGPNPQAVGQATVSATFDNITLDLPATPTGFTYDPSITKVEFGAGCPNPLPSSIGVTLNATATVSDTDASGNPRSATASVQDASFTVTTGGGSVSVSPISGGSMNFSNLGTLLDILRGGGQNTVQLQASLTTQSTPDLAGCTLTVTWGGGSGVVRF